MPESEVNFAPNGVAARVAAATEPAPSPAQAGEPSPPESCGPGGGPTCAITPVVGKGGNAGAQPGSEPQKAEPPFPEEVSVDELQAASPADLQAMADAVGWRTNASRSKHQLIYDLLVWMGQHRTKLKVDGILEIGPENFGMIRCARYSFAPLPEDVFVPLFLVRKFQLQPGQRISGFAKAPREKEKFLAIDRITAVEDCSIEEWKPVTPFDKLTATFPTGRIIMETPKNPSVSARVVDVVAPLGKGQRALICASPRSGKTMLLKEIAKSITVNHPDINLIVLLLDERPEEVTDFEETVQKCEIYSSTFDESPKRHTQVAELVAERAKRLVEQRKDVVILLDSITRLARGYNALQGGKGRTMSGGVESKALIKPKKFFGAARNVEEGGSLTIVATALIETESRMDEVIFEEFKGTGNMEVNLDREISERRIFPAIHVLKSGTRRDDLLYHPEEFKRISLVRKQMSAVPAFEAIELLIRNIQKTANNAELLLKGLRT
ncbi:MAG: transcription termination factor Rho [Verrucomicrobiaceae bacterium]|nr:transcription termination factor Rho [Verrucomicrobiaceae bacterium]